MSTRWDETWHRLLEWTNGQAPSERLAGQILLHERFTNLDPSHPLGGKDSLHDAICSRDGKRYVMAVYFPRGQQSFAAIEKKFLDDLKGVDVHKADGIAFVTNQELRLAEREALVKKAAPHGAELYHLERLTALLDQPGLAAVRTQFLSIDSEDASSIILGGQGGQAPGAGGGGEGAVGPGSVGGGGGGGGDYIRVEVDREEFQRLKALGWDHLDYRVGEGGKTGSVGEDTIVNFVTKDGKVLKSIVAKAGRPGVSPKTKAEGRDVTEDDLNKGFAISSILLAENAQLRDGLLYLLSAGWENYEFATIPFEANWPLALTIYTGDVDQHTIFAFAVTVADPKGFQVYEEEFSISRNPSAVSRPSLLIPLRFTGSVAGVWIIRVVSGRFVLASLPIEIKIRETDQH